MRHLFKDEETVEMVRRGIFGVLGVGGGATVSMQAQIEWWMRVVSLGIGIAIGLATLYGIVQKIKQRNLRHEWERQRHEKEERMRNRVGGIQNEEAEE